MVDLKEVLYPNKFKLIFFIILVIPLISSIILLFVHDYIYYDYNYYSVFDLIDLLPFLTNISFFLVIGLVYLSSGCVIDTSIQNENIKITIAIISGIISLAIIYLFYKVLTEPVICDPVHSPSNDSYSVNVLSELKIDKSAAENLYEQCLNNLKK